MKEYTRRVQINGDFVELEGNIPIPEAKRRGIDFDALAIKMRVNESYLIKSASYRVKAKAAFKKAGVPFIIRQVSKKPIRWRIWKTGEAAGDEAYNLGE